MTVVVFIAALCAGLALVTLSIVSLAVPGIQFWPPPDRHSWQYFVFWALFRVMFYGVVVLVVLDFRGNGDIGLVFAFVSLSLCGIGFGAAFYATFSLGWRNSHGEREGLKTTGWYGWSRNPIYVASIIGIIGAGVFANSFYVNIVLILWSLTYIVAPFLEEPWLDREYGEEFREYKATVPRFIRFSRLATKVRSQR